MGCMPSFHFKSKNYEHILSYSEIKDKRLGDITIVKTISGDEFVMKK